MDPALAAAAASADDTPLDDVGDGGAAAVLPAAISAANASGGSRLPATHSRRAGCARMAAALRAVMSGKSTSMYVAGAESSAHSLKKVVSRPAPNDTICDDRSPLRLAMATKRRVMRSTLAMRA